MSPTARTQIRLRVEGFLVGNVERWNPYAKVRQDLFGFIDTIAIHKKVGVFQACIDSRPLAVQSTSGANHAARVAKVRKILSESPGLGFYFDIQVWSWSERVVRNKDGRKAKVKRWTLRREKVP
jgi:hypothetical protein